MKKFLILQINQIYRLINQHDHWKRNANSILKHKNIFSVNWKSKNTFSLTNFLLYFLSITMEWMFCNLVDLLPQHLPNLVVLPMKILLTWNFAFKFLFLFQIAEHKMNAHMHLYYIAILIGKDFSSFLIC